MRDKMPLIVGQFLWTVVPIDYRDEDIETPPFTRPRLVQLCKLYSTPDVEGTPRRCCVIDVTEENRSPYAPSEDIFAIHTQLLTEELFENELEALDAYQAAIRVQIEKHQKSLFKLSDQLLAAVERKAELQQTAEMVAGWIDGNDQTKSQADKSTWPIG
jgi:hypothetical protein